MTKTGEVNQLTVKNMFGREDVQSRFNELLGKKAQGFITSVLQIVNQNTLLKNAEPSTVLTAAATAATLDLPINPNLGFAYIIPYNNNVKTEKGWEKKVMAQFQMGYKGFIQLAQRSGQYRRINAIAVYENQFKGFNALTEELIGDFSVMGEGKVVGYAAYFELNNGFSKLLYSTYEQIQQHGKKYSKSYDRKNSLWQDQDGGADAMGVKTVLKAILSKYGPLSIEMQTALQADQSVQTEEGQYQYVDNDQKAINPTETDEEKEKSRIIEHISKSDTLEDLALVHDLANETGLTDLYNGKYNEIKDGSDKK